MKPENNMNAFTFLTFLAVVAIVIMMVAFGFTLDVFAIQTLMHTALTLLIVILTLLVVLLFKKLFF